MFEEVSDILCQALKGTSFGIVKELDFESGILYLLPRLG